MNVEMIREENIAVAAVLQEQNAANVLNLEQHANMTHYNIMMEVRAHEEVLDGRTVRLEAMLQAEVLRSMEIHAEEHRVKDEASQCASTWNAEANHARQVRGESTRQLHDSQNLAAFYAAVIKDKSRT